VLAGEWRMLVILEHRKGGPIKEAGEPFVAGTIASLSAETSV
jgi:hypothetical protein